MNNNNINNFIEQFHSLGYQTPNRFEITVTPPKGIKLPRIGIFATSIQVPAHVVNHYKDIMAPSGNAIDIPLKRQYDQSFIIEFIVDREWLVRGLFEEWVDLIFPKSGKNSLYVEYWNNITGTIDIQPLDLLGNVKKTITLNGAWPATIKPAQLSHDSRNEYLTMQVDMNYRNYVIT